MTGEVTIYNSPAITLESSSTAGYSMSLYPNDKTTGGNAILYLPGVLGGNSDQLATTGL